MSIVLPEGGVVIGVGSDIIEVERIEGVHKRHGDRFLDRILTEEEREYCFSMKNPYPHIAARFAAKEAISKAFTTGIGEHLGWKDVSVYKGERQEPLVRFTEKARALMGEVGAKDVLITLSHTANYANAVALLVK